MIHFNILDIRKRDRFYDQTHKTMVADGTFNKVSGALLILISNACSTNSNISKLKFEILYRRNSMPTSYVYKWRISSYLSTSDRSEEDTSIMHFSLQCLGPFRSFECKNALLLSTWHNVISSGCVLHPKDWPR